MFFWKNGDTGNSILSESYRNQFDARLPGKVVLTQPISTTMLVYFLSTIILAVFTWLCLATYSRTEVAPGILLTDVPSAKVIVPATGVIASVNVREGDLVAAGQALVIVNLDRLDATGGGVAAQSVATLEELSGLSKAKIHLLTATQQNSESGLRSARNSSSSRLAQLTSEVDLQSQIVKSNQNLFNQVESLVDRGFVSKMEFERRRQTLLISQQRLAELSRERMSAEQEINRITGELKNVAIESARNRNEAESALRSISLQHNEAESRQSLQISAPIAGRVTAIKASIGKTAKPEAPLMLIVPEGSRLKARIFAPTRAIGFVKAGQEVRLLYDAFPYQRFGSFEGTIVSVSRIVIDPKEIGEPVAVEEPVYELEVALKNQAIDAYGEQIPLRPGMTLTASIVLERQSFLNWLLSPIRAVVSKAQDA